MSSFFMDFRGEEVEVVVDRDSGYEWDTGAHDIEWHFADDAMRDVVLTDEEEAAVWEACRQHGEDRAYDDPD